MTQQVEEEDSPASATGHKQSAVDFLRDVVFHGKFEVSGFFARTCDEALGLICREQGKTWQCKCVSRAQLKKVLHRTRQHSEVITAVKQILKRAFANKRFQFYAQLNNKRSSNYTND